MNKITEKYPCREKLVKQLYSYFGEDDEQLCEAIYIFGQSGIGKSAVLRAFFSSSDIVDKYVIINCIECYSPEILYESIINRLYGHEMGPETGYATYAKCKNMMAFIKCARDGLDVNQRYAIILENAEELRDMEFNMLPCFLKLQELTGLNICTILVSTIPFEKYHSKVGGFDAVIIPVDSYTKSEMVQVLMLDYVNVKKNLTDKESEEARIEILSGLDLDFYEDYITLMLTVFYRVTRDVNELKRMAEFCYGKYIQPVLDGTLGEHERNKLYKNVRPTLLNVLHQYQIGMYAGGIANSSAANNTSKQICQLELPFYTKFLLIAAFLASNNSVKADKKLFVKKSSKKKKSQNVKTKVSEKMMTQIGPQSFTIDRLLAIFTSITVEYRAGLNALMMGQISNLTHLRLLRFVSGEGNILEGSARLQCTVGLDFITHVANTVQFNVRQYLCDFI